MRKSTGFYDDFDNEIKDGDVVKFEGGTKYVVEWYQRWGQWVLTNIEGDIPINPLPLWHYIKQQSIVKVVK
jgi:hypothetical protein